jgi:hypothetical protein
MVREDKYIVIMAVAYEQRYRLLVVQMLGEQRIFNMN